MIIELIPADEKVYKKLFTSFRDLEFAQYCLEVVVRKGWHHAEFERRRSVYLQQAAYTCAFFASYGRAFTESRGWGKLPPDVRRFNKMEADCHKRLMRERNSVFAHTDHDQYTIQPWLSGDFSTDIVGAPVLRISVEDAAMVGVMIPKCLAVMQKKMKLILAKYGVKHTHDRR
jgi:hypothetical protein